MEQEKEAKIEKKGSKLWLWVVIVLTIAIAGLAVWYFTKSDSSDTASSSTETATFTPKHADWQLFTSSKYKIKLYHPSDYTVTESAVGNLTISKGSVEMADLYITSAAGSSDKNALMKSNVASFMSATAGNMTGGSEVDTTAAGVDATMVSGTFGAKAGLSMTHAGEKGSAVTFIMNDYLVTIDGYWNGSTADYAIWEDMIKDIRF